MKKHMIAFMLCLAMVAGSIGGSSVLAAEMSSALAAEMTGETGITEGSVAGTADDGADDDEADDYEAAVAETATAAAATADCPTAQIVRFAPFFFIFLPASDV